MSEKIARLASSATAFQMKKLSEIYGVEDDQYELINYIDSGYSGCLERKYKASYLCIKSGDVVINSSLLKSVFGDFGVDVNDFSVGNVTSKLSSVKVIFKSSLPVLMLAELCKTVMGDLSHKLNVTEMSFVRVDALSSEAIT